MCVFLSSHSSLRDAAAAAAAAGPKWGKLEMMHYRGLVVSTMTWD